MTRAIGLPVAVLLLAAAGCGRIAEPVTADSSAAAIARGVEFLDRTVRESGEFPTVAWLFALPDQRIAAITPFTTAQVLMSLHALAPTPTVQRLGQAGAEFLQSRREPPGVWRFWAREMRRVSPDADDTALVWAALLERGETVPHDVFERFRDSRFGSGLFMTWFGRPESWLYVDEDNWRPDLVVNANALLMFSLAREPAPEVCREVVAATRSKEFAAGTPYYPSALAFTFAVSRAWADGGATCLAEAVPVVRAYALAEQRPDGDWGTALDTALGTLTLLNTGPVDDAATRGVRALLNRQEGDGGWPLTPAYVGGSRLVFGARSWNTALAIETLAKHSRPAGMTARDGR